MIDFVCHYSLLHSSYSHLIDPMFLYHYCFVPKNVNETWLSGCKGVHVCIGHHWVQTKLLQPMSGYHLATIINNSMHWTSLGADEAITTREWLHLANMINNSMYVCRWWLWHISPMPTDSTSSDGVLISQSPLVWDLWITQHIMHMCPFDARMQQQERDQKANLRICKRKNVHCAKEHASWWHENIAQRNMHLDGTWTRR